MCIECPAALANDLMAAFPTLVSHHQDLVYGVARRYSRQASDAEDLAQEAFLRAYKALTTYPPERILVLRLRGWLARITLNLARNRARRRTPSVGTLDAAMDRPDETQVGPAESAEASESMRMWGRLLSGLPEAQRAAVSLRHVDGLSYGELAIALDRPVGTVKSDVHRGVRALRRAYQVHATDFSEVERPGEQERERSRPRIVARLATGAGTP